MTTAQAGTATRVLPVPRRAVDDVLPAPRPPGSRAGSYQRVLHGRVRRELRVLADLLCWAPADEPARTRALTVHADLVGRLLLAHHRLEREELWPALVAAVPDGQAAPARAAVADWSARSARIDAQVRDLGTAARQWAVAGTPAARDVVARACRALADAVDAHTAAEERDLVPLLDAYLDSRRWARVAAAGSCRLTGRERRLVLGLVLEDSCAGDRARLLDGLRRQQRWAWRLTGVRRYRRAVVRLRGEPPAV
ncbi:hemerythrin domain-containing protein [Blastococcus sp. TF02-09]|uniref:hemerythrin domain-containing protein n=1 Tax=Blastococcus sp. TF02-09 TaxID=2250576 RepID=UPI000DE93774|nr:hemerythrin domain-containing protein [Blastococcus sp. TF02-9]RBY76245.1 hemerythrin domain-containing protein [Blastococcus sp. TF02-9]